VFSDKGLLLVRERRDGAWTLPGGWADVGDSPSLAAVREVKEESGYDVLARKLAAVYDRDHDRHGHPPMPYHVYKLFFICEAVLMTPVCMGWAYWKTLASAFYPSYSVIHIYRGHSRVTLVVISSIHAAPWVVICAAK
jgi:ADP-ribose pyrophosphatase YjhB (NUDIX family)